MSTQVFSRSVKLPVSSPSAFTWHERPGALQRLIPPWEAVEVTQQPATLHEGSTVELVNRLGPLRLRWVAQHYDFQPGRQFCDFQREGPFAKWNHLHRFESDDSSRSCLLEDRVEYEIPGGWLGQAVGSRWIQNKIRRMFNYRHETVRADLAAHAQYAEKSLMHVAITGSSGLIGSELRPLLTTGGHQVTPLVRGQAVENQIAWEPMADSFDASCLEGVDAVVHLAGESIAGGRWNDARKQRIRDSRVHSTRILSEALARSKSPPKTLITASAIGFYGDRGDELLDEASPAGSGFLSDVCQEWEGATRPATEAGIRVVHLRFGVVLSPKGGALAKMLTPFKFGAGGTVGSGEQYWSWVSVDDAAGAAHHALMTDSVRGPVNVVAPNPATNEEFTTTLGRVLGRPTIVPMPAFAARLVIGEMADELLLASTRVAPKQLLETGYQFRHPDLEGSLRHVLGR